MQPRYDGPEALDWLRRSRSRSALATNRFRATADAIAFVQLLYSAGAERVILPSLFIQDDPETIREEGGPRASALVVYLPTDPMAWEPLVWLCGWELGAGHMHSNSDPLTAYVGRKAVFLGWTDVLPADLLDRYR